MRIQVCADLHLNNCNYGRVDSDGLSFRTRDFCQAFKSNVDHALELRKQGKLDRYAIVGDIYDVPHPPENVQRIFIEQIARLNESGLAVDILVGNHDACYFYHAIEPVVGAGFENVRVYYQPTVVETKDALLLMFPHSQAIERQEIGFRDALHKFARETADQVKEAKKAGKDVLFFGHFEVFGAKMTSLEENRDSSSIKVEDLNLLSADYIFLGDYHMFQRLPVDNCHAFYTGSLERDDFNDTAPEKGFMVYDSYATAGDPEWGKTAFIPYTGGKRFVDITVRADNFLKEIGDRKDEIAGNVVRVHFIGTTEEHKRFSEARKELKGLLSSAAHVVNKKSVVDPVNDKKVQELKHELEEMGHIESSDIVEIMEKSLRAEVQDDAEREATLSLGKVIMSKVKAEQAVTAEGKPGRIMIHGVKMHNFMRYGEEDNVVEFDKGAGEILGVLKDSFKMDKSAKARLMSGAKKFMAGINREERKLISIVGRTDGNDKDSNGSGKSSCLEGISYGFFEKLVREFAHKDNMDGKSTSSVMTYIDGEPKALCYVEVLFSSENELWLAKRGRRTAKNGSTSGEFGLFCLSSDTGEEGSRSGHRKRDAAGILSQLLKMDYETFSNSVMFGQMDSGRFIRGTDKVKKEIIIKILQLTILDDYLEETREMKRSAERDMAALQSHIGALSESVLDEQGVVNARMAISVFDAEVKESEKRIGGLEADLKTRRSDGVFSRKASLDSELALQSQMVSQKEKELDGRMADLESACVKARTRRDSATGAVKDADNRIVLCRSGIETLENLLKAFDKSRHDKDMDLVAKAKAAKPQRQKELSEGQERLQASSSERGKLSSQIDSLSGGIRKHKDELQALELLASQIQSETERLIKLTAEFNKDKYEKDVALVDLVKAEKPLRQAEFSAGQANLQTLASDKGKLMALIASETAKMQKFQAKLDAGESTCPECENEVSPDHFKSKIKESSSERDALEASLAELHKSYASEEKKVTEAKRQIARIESLLSTEAGLVSQKSSFDRNAEKLEQQKQAVTKAALDKKDLESKMQAETVELGSLTGKLEEINKTHSVETEKVAAIQKKISNIETYMAMESDLVARKSAFDRNTEKLEEQKQALVRLESDKKSLESKEGEETAEFAACAGKLEDARKGKEAELAPLRSRLVETQAKIDALVESLRQANAGIAKAEGELSSERSLRESKMSERTSLETRIAEAARTRDKISGKSQELSEKRTLLDRLLRLEKVFGLDGIRTQVVEKYLPLLNSYCAEFLDVISKGRMSAAVCMDGGEMVIVVTGASAPRAELLSGGEFERLRLSMDIALGLLSLYRNDSAPDFVCADEILAPIDEGGKDLMFEVIRKLQDHFRMVVVISHDKMIQERIKNVIIVSKNGDVSRIEKQAHEVI
jgi:DNA repair exonuclease SbcCD ATPase subunit/DNA repair exonuclease SbcCD nuclease subunit